MSELFSGFEQPITGEVLKVPPSFFEKVVATETTSTIRFVSFVLTKALEGESEVEVSYSELQTLLNLSRCGVNDGIKRAVAAGYVLQIQNGENGTVRSRYALNWAKTGTTPPPSNTNKSPSTPSRANPSSSGQAENQPAPRRSGFNSYTVNSIESNLESKVESKIIPPPDRIKADQSTAATPLSTPFPQHGDKPCSDYLTRLANEFSEELGDVTHKNSNCTQLHNLWHTSSLSLDEFVRLVYEARNLTRRYAILRPGEIPPPPGTKRNQMPYFFTVLRDLITRPADTSASASPSRRQTYAVVDKPTSPRPPRRNTSAQTYPTYNRPIPASWQRLAAAQKAKDREVARC